MIANTNTTADIIIGDMPAKITDMDLKDALDRQARAAAELIQATHALLATMQRYHSNTDNEPKGPIAKLMRGKAHAVAESRLMDLPQEIHKCQLRAGDYQEVMGLD